MAEPTGSPSGTGTGANAGTSGAGGAGTPPAPSTGGGNPPAPPAAGGAAIPIDVLPEQLRGLPESQIKFTLNRMAEGLVKANQRVQELERLSKNPPAPTPKEEPKPKKDEKPLDVRLLEDPEGALDDFLTKRFGGAVQKLSELDERIGRSELAAIRSEIEDFGDYEEEVTRILESGQVPKTRDNILGAYTMVVGQRAIEDRKRARLSALNPEPPAGGDGAQKKNYQKTPLTEEVRISLGMSEDDYYGTYASPDNIEIKVPR